MQFVQFANRQEFRDWLAGQPPEASGVWLLFGKGQRGPVTLSAAEALEEALCFGWIDGQMKKLDEGSYLKYFAPRRKGSKWSAKNRKLAEQLITQGLMREQGQAKIAEAKATGLWDRPDPPPVEAEDLAFLEQQLAGEELALQNYRGMPLSVRKTYVRMYQDAKSEEARERRLYKIIDRLNHNLRPM